MSVRVTGQQLEEGTGNERRKRNIVDDIVMKCRKRKQQIQSDRQSNG